MGFGNKKMSEINEKKLGEALQAIAKGVAKASRILLGNVRAKKVSAPDSPMSIKDFIESCNKSERRAHHIIADWAEVANPDCVTKGQWSLFFRRHVRDATKLTSFTDKQIQDGFTKMEKAKIDKKTLGTLLKFIV